MCLRIITTMVITTAANTEIYYVPGLVPSTLHVLINLHVLILTAT